jgi:hypothetical protein
MRRSQVCSTKYAIIVAGVSALHRPRSKFLSALPRKRTNRQTSGEVRLVPGRDICSAANCCLLDHLISTSEQHRWRFQPKYFSSPEIDN